MTTASIGTTSGPTVDRIGAVAIGRNEGERLRRCLQTLTGQLDHIVYVDSGSTDGSVAVAEELGVTVHELDDSTPFSAARARNEGIDRLLVEHPDIEFAQVIDGDCELRDGWLAAAIETMVKHERAAVVCGRRRERDAKSNIYQRLIDMEWNSPVGEAKACGGDSLIRISAFREVGGFDPVVIAGEEPELCLRLRRAGWTVHRINHEMTWHEANLTRFSQWWKRAVRNGYAYGLGWSMHGGGEEQYRVREVRSILEWALLLPVIAIGLLWLTYGVSVFLLGAYVLLWLRVRRHRIERGDSPDDAEMYGRFVVIGKFAELTGLARFLWHKAMRQRGTIIEYKNDAPSPDAKPIPETSSS